MSRLSKSALLLFVVATLAGACLHFVYALFPNAVTACFSPVQESLWEHLKLLYWPYLAASLLLARNEGWDTLRVRALTLLLCCAAALAAGWLYHIILGGEALFFDVALYVLTMAAAFLLPACSGSFRSPGEDFGCCWPLPWAPPFCCLRSCRHPVRSSLTSPPSIPGIRSPAESKKGMVVVPKILLYKREKDCYNNRAR